MSALGRGLRWFPPAARGGDVEGLLHTLRLALTLARRGLRRGTGGLSAALACLMLAIATIGGVASLRASLVHGLASQGRALLGGDLEIETGALPPSGGLRAWFTKRGARVSEVAMLHAMLVAPSGQRMLVSLKAVDGAWPLVGHARLAPAMTPARALAAGGLVAAPLVFERLALHAGAVVRLGAAHYTLRARLLRQPDQTMAAAGLLGPPALIALPELAKSGLIVPGSLVRYALRITLPRDASAARTEAELARAFPSEDWRVRTARDAAPELGRLLDRTSLFMTLIALTALLVGGVGVASGVGAWAEARLPEVATLRTLGASMRLIAASLLVQVMALSLIAIAIGLALGALAPCLVAAFFGASLPIPTKFALYPEPLGLAAGFGLASALLCTFWPILRAARTAPGRLLRGGDDGPSLPVRPTAAPIGVGLALIAILIGLAMLATHAPRFVAFYAASVAFSLVVLDATGALLARWSARLARRSHTPAIHLGLAALGRPRATTRPVVVALGLGLATLGTVALIAGNLQTAFTSEIPAGAPSFYFIDIQDAELPVFARLMHTLPGVEAWATVPMLRARVTAIDGVPVVSARVSRETRWALNQDLGLTYATKPPANNRIVAGRWWPEGYSGPPLLSLGAKLAKGWGVRLGDRLSLNVLGRTIAFTVTSLREIAWQRLGLNFFLVASPGLLEHAPHTNIATVRATPGARVQLLDRVSDALPNVSAIEVAGVIAAVGRIFGRITRAGSVLAGVTLAIGVIVLGVTLVAEERRRRHEAVILKTLGATRAQIRTAGLVSFAMLGASAGAIAALIAVGASFGIVRYLMHGHWVFLPLPLALTLLAGLVLALLGGVWATERVLATKAARWLGRDA